MYFIYTGVQEKRKLGEGEEGKTFYMIFREVMGKLTGFFKEAMGLVNKAEGG